jgi:FkbM family methyltransferase
MSAGPNTLQAALAWLRAPRAEQIVLRGLPIRFAAIDGDSGDQLRAGYESEVLDFIDTLPPDAVLYDLGASIGHFSLYAAARGLRTFAFEPDPTNYAALEANARTNRFPTLTTLSIAISDRRDDDAVLRSNSAKQRVGDHHKVLAGPEFSGHEAIGSSLDTAVTVKAMSLDGAIDELRLVPPSALKVDIDGSELAFVRGAERTLHDRGLQSILIELWQESSHYASVVRELESAGLHKFAEHQVYSSIGIEEGLYNIHFERTVA